MVNEPLEHDDNSKIIASSLLIAHQNQKINFSKGSVPVLFKSDVDCLPLKEAIICSEINLQLLQGTEDHVLTHFCQCLQLLLKMNGSQFPEHSLFIVHIKNDQHIVLAVDNVSSAEPQIHSLYPFSSSKEPKIFQIERGMVDIAQKCLESLFKKKSRTLFLTVNTKELNITIGAAIAKFILFWSEFMVSKKLVNFTFELELSFNQSSKKTKVQALEEKQKKQDRPEKRARTEPLDQKENSYASSLILSQEDILTSLLGSPSTSSPKYPFQEKHTNPVISSNKLILPISPIENDSVYTDQQIQALLQLSLRHDNNVHISSTHDLFVWRNIQLFHQCLSAMKDAIQKAMMGVIVIMPVKILDLLSESDSASHAEHYWGGIVIRKDNRVISIKFIDPFGVVREKIKIEINEHKEAHFIKIDKTYTILDCFTRNFDRNSSERLCDNGMQFCSLIFHHFLPLIKHEIFQGGYRLDLCFSGICQIKDKIDAKNSGPLIVMDLVQEAIGNKLKKYPADLLRRLQKDLLEKEYKKDIQPLVDRNIEVGIQITSPHH